MMTAVELERAWYVFALAPDRLSWRHFPTYCQTYRVDHRIAIMRDAGEWPPPVQMRERWPDLDDWLSLIGDHQRYGLTLADDHGPRLVHMPPAAAKIARKPY